MNDLIPRPVVVIITVAVIAVFATFLSVPARREKLLFHQG